MLILAIDTSGKSGSVALAVGEADGSCKALEVVPLEGGTFSAQLIPQVAALLAKNRLGKRSIDALAATSGPGSFTGLRVGLAAIKALAEVLNKPIAAVSLLEALAVAPGVPGEVLVALDAGRNEVYAGEYHLGKEATLVKEHLLTREEFLSISQSRNVVTSDAVIAESARNVASLVFEVPRPRSDVIARLGWKKVLAGQTVSPAALEANYIRRSDAEILSKPA
jgi:tRNA threonylcarbamoyladenosine biosynthesis protein TsaB